MTEHLHIYGDSRSGNCYKVQLLCSQLDRDYEWTEVDILAGATRTEEFLAMNPNGKIPLLVVDGARRLPESNAILCYLAGRNGIAGRDDFERALVLSWLFFEQYSHEPYIATSRFIVKYLGNPPERRATLEEKRPGGYRALDILEQALARQPFIAGDHYTIADIALFAYTHVADEGGFDLGAYTHLNRWLDRVRTQTGFVAMRAPSG